VTLTLGGAPVSFTSCPVCEWRAWERDGEVLPLDSVLHLVATG
jgi:hypothetical protein